MSIGSRIKELRENKNISRNDFAAMIGVTVGAISNYENDVSSPKEPILFKIIEVLECEPNYIFQDMVKIKNQNNDVTLAEYDHIKKYRDLDPHGKEMVDFTLLKEWERSTAEPKPETKTSSSTADVIPMRFLSYYQKMASAGSGEFLFPDIPTEVIAVPDTPLSRKADFVIGVSGRSMEDTYFDGDKVLVEKTQDVPIGEIGIFIRGSECFIKEAGKDRLISHNVDKEQYPDIIPDERRIDAIGIVLGKVGD